MSNNKVRKTADSTNQETSKAFDPTKSKLGKIIIVVLTTGMFIGMVIAAIYGMVSVLSS